MFKKSFALILFATIFLPNLTSAQVDEDQLGGWYMYFWNTTFTESKFGLQGDIQYRNWDIMGDLEQLLLRGGLTYSPANINAKFTAGYGHITSGTFGESSNTSTESRIYQEALLPHKLSEQLLLTHRFRYEQRWVETQDFRTRFRYNLFLNIPLNQPNLNRNSVYLAFYNEIFINGERNIGEGRTVELFDRNRFYSAIGYGFTDSLRMQFGYLKQTNTAYSKGQLQLSLHHTL